MTNHVRRIMQRLCRINGHVERSRAAIIPAVAVVTRDICGHLAGSPRLLVVARRAPVPCPGERATSLHNPGPSDLVAGQPEQNAIGLVLCRAIRRSGVRTAC